MNTPALYDDVIEVLPQNLTAGTPNYNRDGTPHTPAPAHYYQPQQLVAQPSNDLSHAQVVNSLKPGESVSVTTVFSRTSSHDQPAATAQPIVFGMKEVLGIAFALLFIMLLIIGALK